MSERELWIGGHFGWSEAMLKRADRAMGIDADGRIIGPGGRVVTGARAALDSDAVTPKKCLQQAAVLIARAEAVEKAAAQQAESLRRQAAILRETADKLEALERGEQVSIEPPIKGALAAAEEKLKP